MSIQDLIQEGLQAAQAGDIERAAAVFARVVTGDPRSELGWLYLGMYRSKPEEKEFCFRRVLVLNPNNREARHQLDLLKGPAPVASQDESPAEWSRTPVGAPESQPAPAPAIQPVKPAHLGEQARTPVQAKPAERQPEPLREPRPKKKGRAFLALAVLILLVALVGGGYSFWYRSRGNPTATVPSSPPLDSPSAQVTQPVQPTSAYNAVFEASDCPATLPPGAVAECGYVVVPEDRHGDPTDTIRLAVIRYRSQASSPRSDPIVFLQDGPGREALDWSVQAYRTVIQPFLDTRDFVVFDPRGTGRSLPALKCDDFLRTYFLDLQGKVPDAQRTESYKGAVLTCRTALMQAGIKTGSYTTQEMAEDVKDVITALGYTQADLYAISHGTRVAQMVMKNHPGLVQSAILDSAIPLGVEQANQGSGQPNEALELLLDECAAEAACQTAFPDLRKDYESAVQQLEDKPVVLSVPVQEGLQFAQRVDGLVFKDAVTWALRTSQTIPLVPTLIHKAGIGDYSLLSFVLSIPLQRYDSINMGIYLSVNCHDQYFAYTTETLDSVVAEMCSLWDTRAREAGENEMGISGIPVLLVSGKYDSFMSAAFTGQLKDKLTGSQQLAVPDQGHAPTISGVSDCPLRVMRAFVDSPYNATDETCAQQTAAIRFVVPYTMDMPMEFFPVQDDELKLVTQFPLGWVKTGQNQYDRANSIVDDTQVNVQKSAYAEKQFLAFIMTNFEKVGGFDSMPLVTDKMDVNGLEWHIYQTTLLGQPVDMAFARSEPNTLLVIMLSNADEHEALYRNVFLPMIEATKSLD